MPASGASLWLLEAKAFAEDDRSQAACSVQYWLKPGGPYMVGRAGADLVVEDDKSISRRHAELTVPCASEWLGGEEEVGANGPHVLIKDLSKYGTYLDPSPDAPTFKGPALGAAAPPAPVTPNTMLRFGYKSPFKLYLQDWALFLSPKQRQAAGAGTVKALQEAAAATGLPLTDDLPDHPGTRVLALAGAPLQVDGTVLLALLRGYAIVGADWLLAWEQQRVWRNARPQESAYPVQLQYHDGSAGTGTMLPKVLPGPAALLAARKRQALRGRTLLWLPPARGKGSGGGAALQEAALLLGAANHDVAASGRAAAVAKAEGAVLVRGSPEDPLPSAYGKLPWTTPQLLLAGVLEGDLEGAMRPPVVPGSPAATPASRGGKGRGKKAAAGGRSTTGGGGKGGQGRGRAAAAAAEEEEEEEEGGLSGSETDVSEDLEHLRETQRQLALDDHGKHAVHAAPAGTAAPAAGTAAAAAPTPQERQRAEGREAAAEAAAPLAKQAAVAGRKRRQPEQQEEHQQDLAAATTEAEEVDAEAAQPTAAKRRRQVAPAAAASAATPAPAAATPAQRKPLAGMPSGEGWHSSTHHLQQAQQQGAAAGDDAGLAGRAPAAAAPAAPASTSKRKPKARPAPAVAPAAAAVGGGSTQGRRRRTAAADAAAAARENADEGEMPDGDGDGAATAAEAAADGQAEEGAEVSEEGCSFVAYMPLLVARPAEAAAAAAPAQGRARGSGGSNGAAGAGTADGGAGRNFKAFRKGGSGGGGVAGAAAGAGERPLIVFDPEPYSEEAAIDVEKFLKVEAKRRKDKQVSEDLFTANMKAKKAAQLPDPDGDTPPKGRGGGGGRGRGGKKAAAPDAGQASMLNFLPAAGRGRGRGGGGRGKSKA